MIINKSELMNDIDEININKIINNDDLMDIQSQIASHLVSKSDFDSSDDYQDAVDLYFSNGENRLCFVKRDTVLCSALMNFYAPDGNVKDFDKIAKKNINGYYSQLLADDNEGFFFVASNDCMDALVPYNMQDKFMRTLNPSIKNQIKANVSTKLLNKISKLLNSGVKTDTDKIAIHKFKETL